MSLKQIMRTIILRGEYIGKYNGKDTWRDVWYENVNGEDVVMQQFMGGWNYGPEEIADPKEIKEMEYYFQRYRPDGSRI